MDLILFLVAWETTESSALDLRIYVEKRGSDEVKIMDEKELNSSDAEKSNFEIIEAYDSR